MVAAIYESRSFCVKEAGATSSDRHLSTGIAQGCPLSPYLFIIVLSVIFEDADVAAENDPERFFDGDLECVIDITYADDTLLASSDPARLQRYLDMLQK